MEELLHKLEAIRDAAQDGKAQAENHNDHTAVARGLASTLNETIKELSALLSAAIIQGDY